MRPIITLVITLAASLSAAAAPPWADDAARARSYPRDKYLAGFAFKAGDNSALLAAELKAAARSELIEGITVSVSSAKELYKSEIDGVYGENFSSLSSTFSEADINGLVLEYFYDESTKTGYAFAYADKGELRGYYKATVSIAMQKIRGIMEQAAASEAEGSKGRARREYESALPLLSELSVAQSLLVAIDGADSPAAMIGESIAAHNEARRAISRMQGAIVVCVASSEHNLGQPLSLLAPRIESLLASRGCSFTDDAQGADWLLNISANTRQGSAYEGICFSYLDAEVSITDCRTGREIYRNVFSDIKGGGMDFVTAGRNAYKADLEKIVAEIAGNLEK
jgi:hypothetical protein